MKRRFTCLMILALLTLSVTVAPGAAASQIRVFLHGVPVVFPDQIPVVVDGRTLVPIRGVFEVLGANVKWEPEALRVTVSWRGNQAAVFIGNRTAWVNGERRTLDVAPRIIGDRTVVPLRFLAESLGLQVRWYGRYRAVVIGERPALPVLGSVDSPGLTMPCTVRIAMRPISGLEPLTKGPYTVTEIELSSYVADVLAWELGDFNERGVTHTYSEEALKAGAVAILSYAWLHAWKPPKNDYDVDNSANFQVYKPGIATSRYRAAVRAVWGTYMVHQESGSPYLAMHWAGSYSADGKGSGRMNQRGAQYLVATNGYNWWQLLQYYYPKLQLCSHPSPCAGPD